MKQTPKMKLDMPENYVGGREEVGRTVTLQSGPDICGRRDGRKDDPQNTRRFKNGFGLGDGRSTDQSHSSEGSRFAGRACHPAPDGLTHYPEAAHGNTALAKCGGRCKAGN